MPAGMATAVPKPAMPSIKPPKHQATSSASRRRSLLMEVIMPPITSMAPVRTHRLYVKTAAIITSTMGHRAIKKPSSEAVAICAAGRCHHAKARTHERTNEPMAAFQAGHLKHSSITTSQMIGTRASKNAATSMGKSSLVPRRRHRGGHKTSTEYRTLTDKLMPPAEFIEQPVQKHESIPSRLY